MDDAREKYNAKKLAQAWEIDRKSSLERAKLNFAAVVEENFAFLADFGFQKVEALPTRVFYSNGSMEVDVYHGRSSYEIGFGITRNGVHYSLGPMIRLSDPKFAEAFRYPSALTEAAVAKFVATIADLVRQYCIRGLRGEPEFFEALALQRNEAGKQLAIESLAYNNRPRAHEAFRLHNYREAARLYKEIEASLSPVEVKKLALAEKRSSNVQNE